MRWSVPRAAFSHSASVGIGFQADGDDLAEQMRDVLQVVGAFGIGGDIAAPVVIDAILVDHLFEGGAIAEAIVIARYVADKDTSGYHIRV